MKTMRTACAMTALTVLCTGAVRAQAGQAGRALPDPAGFQLGVQVASTWSSQFDAADPGLGGRVSWHPTRIMGIEGEVNLYPGEFPNRRPFSRGRLEGLFGVTAGVTLNRVRPFARLRPGFVTVRESPAPFACIRIFPPPLACSLAGGDTLLALDAGGGVEITTTSRTFLRVDVGDRLLRYPGPVFDNDRVIRERAFFSHDVRLATGAGVRF